MFNNIHSKRFLLTYLSVVAVLLLFFLALSEERGSGDHEAEDGAMLTAFEPPLVIPQFLGHGGDNAVFTNESLVGKWSFVFVIHEECGDCAAIIDVLSNLKAGLANNLIQVVFLEDTGKQTQKLHELTQSKNLPAQVISVTEMTSEKTSLANFFTRSRAFAHQDLAYAVFLVNPKGTLSARYQAPFTSVLIRQSFLQIRSEFVKQD